MPFRAFTSSVKDSICLLAFFNSQSFADNFSLVSWSSVLIFAWISFKKYAKMTFLERKIRTLTDSRESFRIIPMCAFWKKYVPHIWFFVFDFDGPWFLRVACAVLAILELFSNFHHPNALIGRHIWPNPDEKESQIVRALQIVISNDPMYWEYLQVWPQVRHFHHV